MKYLLHALILFLFAGTASAQDNPAIYSWLQNTTETGSYYMAGNSTEIENNILVNCQQVAFSDDYAYVTTTGVPSYPTGPFQDGNPSQAADQEAIYQFPLFPQENEGTPIETNAGSIGIFINGVSLYDYRDGVAWNPETNALCGGPGNPPCPGGMGTAQAWNRDAIPAELPGFDCAKGHPAMGNYHHHQNPSAFNLDITVVSDVCDLYAADGLYAIDENSHSPLVGFAYDGFPIYGAYGFANADGTGGITRIKSGYSLRNITERTEYADGTDVDNGPDVDNTYYLGYFREDYEYIDNGADDYLDEHNGRFCVTPEYPEGIYAYFCTVDENWNSSYPYAVGPTFYGQAENRSVASINEEVTIYDGSNAIATLTKATSVNIFPNPSSEIIAIQVEELVTENLQVALFDLKGRQVATHAITAGSTIAYFDVQTLYAGTYIVVITGKEFTYSEEIIIHR
ncbi:MAG: YHYH protein [Flavobacteriales bacterium]|nr:YHYH protein [Flavobacteriales bacterium]